MSGRRIALLLYTGPLAWLAQLCIGAALTSWPCFPKTERLIAPLAGYRWTYALAIALLTLSTVAAGVAALLSARTFAASRHGAVDARTCFIALWGMCLGGGFALATLVTLVAFLLVPQCVG